MKNLILIATLLVSCTSEEHTSRKVAADNVCAAFCERAHVCDSSVVVTTCIATCVGEACAGGCTGNVSDEARLDACIDAIEVLACSAPGLPGSCSGVIR
jgi:hypothetical protein